MRIAVIGLGGVGGFIAASLANTSHEIVGFARGEHLKKIKENGLKIIEDDKEWSVDLEVNDLEDAKGYFDIVIFCVKSYDLETSYKAISGFIDSKTIILSLANGVSNGDTLRKLSNSKVLDATVYILSQIQSAGVIRKKGKVFAFVFGGDKKASDALEAIFKETTLKIKVPSDIKKALWSKYLFISAFAKLTSYYNESIGFVCEKHYDEALELLNEIAFVAETKNINIFDDIQKALDTAKNIPYEASTSMCLDFKNKKKDELESLSGYVLIEAKKHDVKIPVMQKMYRALLKRHVN